MSSLWVEKFCYCHCCSCCCWQNLIQVHWMSRGRFGSQLVRELSDAVRLAVVTYIRYVKLDGTGRVGQQSW